MIPCSIFIKQLSLVNGIVHIFSVNFIFSAFSTVIKAPEMETLKIPLNRVCDVINDISVWEWSGSALDEGNEASEWFTKYLGKPSRLVRFNIGNYLSVIFVFLSMLMFFSLIT